MVVARGPFLAVVLVLLAILGCTVAAASDKTGVCAPDAPSCSGLDSSHLLSLHSYTLGTRSLVAPQPVPGYPDCAAGRFVSEFRSPGAHLFCLKLAGGEDASAFGTGPNLHVKVWVDGAASDEQDFVIPGLEGSSGAARTKKQMTKDFVAAMEARFPRHPNVFYDNPKRQPWRVFDVQGRVVPTLGESLAKGAGFLLEGGQWIWPGVREGFKQRVEDMDDLGADVWIETMSMSPLVLRVHGFLKDLEIEKIIETSRPKMHASGVALMDKDKGKPATEWRTSTTHWLRSSQHPWIAPVDRRVAAITRVPVEHQEDVQVLRYEHTQKYDAHHDYFSPEFHTQNPQTLAMIENGVKNRMATVFWYMSDVEEGGTTWFPLAFGSPWPTSMKACTGGLHVPPKKGSVIIFYSMLPNGGMDKQSLHAGCPVTKGEKWSANKWVWNKPRGD